MAASSKVFSTWFIALCYATLFFAKCAAQAHDHEEYGEDTVLDPEDEKMLTIGKSILMVVIFVLQFSTSLVPWLLARTPQASLAMALCNMASVGLLLGAAFCHILPHSTEKYVIYLESKGKDAHYPYAGVAAGSVLLLLIFVDTWVVQRYAPRIHAANEDVNNPFADNPVQLEASGENDDKNKNEPQPASFSINNPKITSNVEEAAATPTVDDHDTHHHHHHHRSVGERGTIRQVVRAWIFFSALSLHAIFDGTSIGAENRTAGFWSMSVAVVSHKALDGFVVGVAVFYAKFSRVFSAVLLLFCASMTPLGIGIGWAATSLVSDEQSNLASAVILSLSAGSFFFIALQEMLPLGIESYPKYFPLKLVLSMLGFALMAVLAIWSE